MNRRKFIERSGATALSAAALVAASPSSRAAQKVKPKAKPALKKKVLTDKAPKPVGPYSQAIIAGNTIYVAGQVPRNAATGQDVTSSFEDQAVQVFENVKAIVEGAGSTLESVVRVNVYLADLKDFQKMNEVYRRYFSGDFPARTTVGAQLLGTYAIEVDCIAVK